MTLSGVNRLVTYLMGFPGCQAMFGGNLDLHDNYNDPRCRKNLQYLHPELLKRPCNNLKWRTHLTWTKDIVGSLANIYDEDMIRVHIRWMKDLQERHRRILPSFSMPCRNCMSYAYRMRPSPRALFSRRCSRLRVRIQIAIPSRMDIKMVLSSQFYQTLRSWRSLTLTEISTLPASIQALYEPEASCRPS
jgi:hypothetical protein